MARKYTAREAVDFILAWANYHADHACYYPDEEYKHDVAIIERFAAETEWEIDWEHVAPTLDEVLAILGDAEEVA